jgi:hypothetical protein
MKINAKPINIESRFYIADSEQVLFALSKPGTEDEIAVWLNTPFFTSALTFLFEKAIGEKN